MTPDRLHNLVSLVAASLWLHACADACERARADGVRNVPHPGQGGDWEDIVPELGAIPQRFYGMAATALGSIPLPTLSAGREAWLRLTGCDDERFGHVVASRLIGSGVGLSDDYRTSAVNTAQDRADVDTVERLNRALPNIGEACTLYVEWRPKTRRCV